MLVPEEAVDALRSREATVGCMDAGGKVERFRRRGCFYNLPPSSDRTRLLGVEVVISAS
jgi:hypothetical protein